LDYLTAIVGVPLVLGLLGVGIGLLVRRVSGDWLPLALVPPVGLAGLICLGQVTTAFGAVVPITVFVCPAGAAVGFWLGRASLPQALSRVRRSPWPLVAVAVAYAIAIAPVLLAGRATLTAYLLDSTAGVQMAGADRILEHGRDLSSLPDSSYSQYLEAYFGIQYPSGAHVVLGLLGRLLPAELMWLYQPFLASMLAFCTPSLWWLLRRFGATGAIAAVGAVVAAVPALVYAYSLMGAIKEITLLPVLVLLFALVVLWSRWLGGAARAVLPIGLAAGAGLGVIGLAFGAWLLVAAVVLAAAAAEAARRHRLRIGAIAWQIGALAAAVAVAALPTLKDLASSLTLAKSLSESNVAAANDPGNLLQPLKWLQVFGVWLHGTHRIDPPAHFFATLSLITLVGIAAAFGLIALARRRQWSALAFLVGAALVWWLLTRRGTTWTDAKLIVLSSPLVLLLAFVGVSGLAQAARRAEAALLLAAVALGVLWSDALLYHDTNLAPTARFDEQQQINDHFAGQGPTLLTDFDEYALFGLRDLEPSSPGFALEPAFAANYGSGAGVPYGATVDLDELSEATVSHFRLVVMRRSPERSLPPMGYTLAWRGRSYEVWRRTEAAERVRRHVGVQGSGRSTGVISCGDLRRLSEQSDGAQFAVSTGTDTVVRDPHDSTRSGGWFDTPAGGLGISGPGRLQTEVRVARAGQYRLWLKGDFNRSMEISVDGERVGSVAYDSGGQGSYARPVSVRLAAGRHRIDLVRPGGSLEPGNGGPARVGLIVLEPAWPGSEPRRELVSTDRWRSLCRQPLDWVEVVAPSSVD
jgi:hypothetical protein